MSRGGRHPFPTSSTTLVVMWIAISTVITGVAIGMFWLASLWGGVSTGLEHIYILHPYIMLTLITPLFVMGVAYTLLPPFWGGKPSKYVAGVGISLLIGGESAYIVGIYSGYLDPLVGGVASLLASIVFTASILSTVKFENKLFLYPDLFITSSLSTLPIFYFIRLMLDLGVLWRVPNSHLYLIIITGFITPLIIGVSTRTMKFKFTTVDMRLLRVSFYLFLSSITTLLLGVAGLVWRGLWIYLLYPSIILYSISYNVFERSPGEEYLSRMGVRDLTRYIFFRRHINAGGFWLLAGYTILLIYYSPNSIFNDVFIWDAGLHSLTLGFMGNYILAYLGVMIPPITLRKAAYRNLNSIPLALLNIAISIRVLADVYTPLRSAVTAYIHGILILGVVASTIYVLARSLRE